MKSLGTHIELVRSLDRRPRPIHPERALVSIVVGSLLGLVLIGGGLMLLERIGIR